MPDDGLPGWHWLRGDGCLNHRPYTKVEVGQTLRVEPPIEMCRRGLHASLRALDALQYAPGSIACRVRLSGEILDDSDKSVATERTCLAMADATAVLHEFACRCAESALMRIMREAGHEPDVRSWKAIKVKRAWLRGEATDADLAVAGAAARAAAGAAAGAAARDAAWDAARAAAWDAAWDAARAAAWDAAWAEHNRWLEEMLGELLGEIAHP